MTVFSLSDFVSKGARHMAILGAILTLIGCIIHIAGGPPDLRLGFLAGGIGLVGGAVTAMLWDFSVYSFQKRQLEKAYIATVEEIQGRLKKYAGDAAGSKTVVRHARVMIEYRLEELRKYGGNAALIANLEAKYRMLANDIEASTGFKLGPDGTWMGN